MGGGKQNPPAKRVRPKNNFQKHQTNNQLIRKTTRTLESSSHPPFYSDGGAVGQVRNIYPVTLRNFFGFAAYSNYLLSLIGLVNGFS